MEQYLLKTVNVETAHLHSHFLKRAVTVDFYLPANLIESDFVSLLLINDGQDLPKMNFDALLDELNREGKIHPVLCVGIYANEDRKMEYGTSNFLDY